MLQISIFSPRAQGRWWDEFLGLQRGNWFNHCVKENSFQEVVTKEVELIPTIWVFPTIGVPQNGWFVMENPIKMDDWRYPIFGNTHLLVISRVHLLFKLFPSRKLGVLWWKPLRVALNNLPSSCFVVHIYSLVDSLGDSVLSETNTTPLGYINTNAACEHFQMTLPC